MNQTFKIHLAIFALIVLSNLLFVDITSAHTLTPCEEAVPVSLNDTYRGYQSEAATTEYFSIEVPSAGIAMIEISAPGMALTEPKLGPLGQQCVINGFDADAAIIEATVKHQTIAFRSSGSYFFRIAAQDPRKALGSYRLQTRFAAAEAIDRTAGELETQQAMLSVRQTDFYLDELSAKQEPGEVDPDPEKSHVATAPALQLFTLYQTAPEGSDLPTARLAIFESSPRSPLPHLEPGEVDPDPEKLEPGEVDPDPESNFVANHTLRNVLTVFSADPRKLEPGEVDPDPEKLEPGEVDPDPEKLGTDAFRVLTRSIITLEDLGSNGPADISLLQWLADLIWPGASTSSEATDRYMLLGYDRQADGSANTLSLRVFCEQDHLGDSDDLLACARPLTAGTKLAGEIAGPWGDDTDTFALTVTEATTLRLETTGSTDTFGALYDSKGRRLAVDDDSGNAGNFQMVETLEAGQYFLRVEGSNRSEGSFEIHVATLGW